MRLRRVRFERCRKPRRHARTCPHAHARQFLVYCNGSYYCWFCRRAATYTPHTPPRLLDTLLRTDYYNDRLPDGYCTRLLAVLRLDALRAALLPHVRNAHTTPHPNLTAATLRHTTAHACAAHAHATRYYAAFTRFGYCTAQKLNTTLRSARS